MKTMKINILKIDWGESLVINQCSFPTLVFYFLKTYVEGFLQSENDPNMIPR